MLSKIKFASREVAKIDLVEGAKRLDWLQVDGQRRALREKEETRHHRGSEDQVPEQGETRQAVGGGEAVEGDRDQREGGEDAGRVRGEVPLHAAGDGAAPDWVQIHAGRHGKVRLQYQ